MRSCKKWKVRFNTPVKPCGRKRRETDVGAGSDALRKGLASRRRAAAYYCSPRRRKIDCLHRSPRTSLLYERNDTRNSPPRPERLSAAIPAPAEICLSVSSCDSLRVILISLVAKVMNRYVHVINWYVQVMNWYVQLAAVCLLAAFGCPSGNDERPDTGSLGCGAPAWSPKRPRS